MLSIEWLKSILSVIDTPALYVHPVEGWSRWSAAITGVETNPSTIAGRIAINEGPPMMHGLNLLRAVDGELEDVGHTHFPDIHTEIKSCSTIEPLRDLVERLRTDDREDFQQTIPLPSLKVEGARVGEVALLSAAARLVRIEFESGGYLPLTPLGSSEIYPHFTPVLQKEDGAFYIGAGRHRQSLGSFEKNSDALRKARAWFLSMRDREWATVKQQAMGWAEGANRLEIEMAQIFLDTDKVLVTRDARTIAKQGIAHDIYSVGVSPFLSFYVDSTSPPVVKVALWALQAFVDYPSRVLYYPGLWKRLAEKYRRSRGTGEDKLMGFVVQRQDGTPNAWVIKSRRRKVAKVVLNLPHFIAYQARNKKPEKYEVPLHMVRALDPKDFVAWAVWHTSLLRL